MTVRHLSMAMGLALSAFVSGLVRAENVTIEVSARPLHDGRINPMLLGNFIELVDDLVPGMWAEMLNDRGFDGVSRPANWVYCDGAPNICDREWDKNDTWALDAEGAFNGPRCAKLTASALPAPATSGASTRPASVTQSELAIKKGATYLFSGWLRGDEPNVRARVQLKALLPAGECMVLASADLGSPTAEWKQQTARLTSTGTTDRCIFELQVTGRGHVWVDKLSLMPADNLLGWRPDVVEAIKAVRTGIIRWGGSSCDPGAYRWKEGIGDRDRRSAFPNRVWGRIDSNDVGIDEFCQFCELVKAEPLICVSFSDGPQSAADLVQYCNAAAETTWGARRAANGHPKPYRVKYWQIGNEISGDDAKYLTDAPAFCRAMKQADREVALLSSFPSQKLLETIGKDIAYVAPHQYTPDLAACEAEFKKLAEMIAKTPDCGLLRVAVTEWNVTAGSWGLMRGKLLTLEAALQNARYLNLLCRYSHIVEIACRSNMTNSLGSGIIGTRPGAPALLLRPSYHVMKLYAEHLKPIPLAVDNLPAGLDVAACISERKDAICVFAVNARPEPAAVSLDLTELGSSFKPRSGEVVCDTLDARQGDLMNHWTAPDRVRTTRLPIDGGGMTLPALSAAAIECGPR